MPCARCNCNGLPTRQALLSEESPKRASLSMLGVECRLIPQEVFRLGVWSSASQRTVSSVIPMLEEAAAPGKNNPEARLLPFQ